MCYYSCFVGLKLFGKAHVEVNVSLGQLINNPLFNEAESEFHVSSYFKTKIDIRNALHVSLTYARHSEIVCRLFMYAFVTTLRFFSCCTTSAPTYLTPLFTSLVCSYQRLSWLMCFRMMLPQMKYR